MAGGGCCCCTCDDVLELAQPLDSLKNSIEGKDDLIPNPPVNVVCEGEVGLDRDGVVIFLALAVVGSGCCIVALDPEMNLRGAGDRKQKATRTYCIRRAIRRRISSQLA